MATRRRAYASRNVSTTSTASGLSACCLMRSKVTRERP